MIRLLISASSERIQRSSSTRSATGRPGIVTGIEAVDVGVDREERIDVAQLERKLLLHRAHVAQRVARWRPGRVAGEEEPAEGVRAGGRAARAFDGDPLLVGQPRHVVRQDLERPWQWALTPSVARSAADTTATRRGRRLPCCAVKRKRGRSSPPSRPVDLQRSARKQVQRFEILAREQHLAVFDFEPCVFRSDNGEVRGHAIEDHVGRGVVALRLRFLLARRIADVAEHDAGPERVRVVATLQPQLLLRLGVEHQRRDHQQRVEPAARLIDRLGDEVRGEGPLEAVSALRAGSPTARTACSPSRTSRR